MQTQPEQSRVVPIFAHIAYAMRPADHDGNHEYASTNGLRIKIDDPLLFAVLVGARVTFEAVHDDLDFRCLGRKGPIDIAAQR